MRTRTARALTRLYPRSWRREHGDEFANLLLDTSCRPAALLDVVTCAAREHLRRFSLELHTVVALGMFALMDVYAVRTGVTANVVWAPTTLWRAAVLVAALAPLVSMPARMALDRVRLSRR
jgi:hypothetical protein